MTQNTTTTDDATETEEQTDAVRTLIGTMVYETPASVYNPVTQEFEDLRELSEDGYKRRFLAVRSASETTHTIDLDSHPVAHFDGDKWECREQDGDHILIKRDAEVTIDE